MDFYICVVLKTGGGGGAARPEAGPASPIRPESLLSGLMGEAQPWLPVRAAKAVRRPRTLFFYFGPKLM